MNKKMEVIIELYKEFCKGKYETVHYFYEKTLLEINKEIPDLSMEDLSRIEFGYFVYENYLMGELPDNY